MNCRPWSRRCGTRTYNAQTTAHTQATTQMQVGGIVVLPTRHTRVSGAKIKAAGASDDHRGDGGEGRATGCLQRRVVTRRRTTTFFKKQRHKRRNTASATHVTTGRSLRQRGRDRAENEHNRSWFATLGSDVLFRPSSSGAGRDLFCPCGAGANLVTQVQLKNVGGRGARARKTTRGRRCPRGQSHATLARETR